MRPRLTPTMVWGGVLVVAGGLMLLAKLEVVTDAALFWAAVFAVGAAAFGYLYAADARHWWAAIPGGALLGLAGVTAWDGFDPAVGGDLGGTLFLGSVALGFWGAYLRDHRRWWAILPGGGVATLAIVAGMSEIASSQGSAVGAVFFLGLAATFALVAVLPPGRPHRWALVPATALAVVAVLAALEALEALAATEYVVPLALIVGGLAMVWRSFPHEHHGASSRRGPARGAVGHTWRHT